jgi:hypothetical protein
MGSSRMMTGWKYALASVIGTYHTEKTIPCQDNNACHLFSTDNDTEVLVAIVSDGAGSASRSETGSALACSFFLEEMKAFFECDGRVCEITREFVERWIKRFQEQISIRAQIEGLRPRDFACTFLAAVVGTDSAVFMQIGDGAIVTSGSDDSDEYNWIFWPQQGEYANITNFSTDEAAAERLEYSLVDHRIDELAIFTDGLQGLALHYQSRKAHTPFFQPMFAWLRPISVGYSEKLSASLSSFLNSQKVNDRTDDDKTLILATRRSGKLHDDQG